MRLIFQSERMTAVADSNSSVDQKHTVTNADQWLFVCVHNTTHFIETFGTGSYEQERVRQRYARTIV